MLLGFYGQAVAQATSHSTQRWGATGYINGGRRFLTSAQYAETRRKRADLDAKLKQMTAVERDRRR
jgi:hypothetical protein